MAGHSELEQSTTKPRLQAAMAPKISKACAQCSFKSLFNKHFVTKQPAHHHQ